LTARQVLSAPQAAAARTGLRATSRGALVAVLASCWCFSLAVGACSLGLDESKIGASLPPVDGSTEANAADAPGGDVASDGSLAATYTPCTTAKDCPTPNACATPRCDDTRKVCVYDQCPTAQACSARACDPLALTCSPAPSTYGFRAAQIKLPGGGTVGCGNSPSRCFAASYPFVFVGAASGSVLAYPVANPGEALPPLVPIEGLAFVPDVVVASGPRVWFFGTRFASNGVVTLPVAAIDVPTDPTVKKLTARTVYLTQPVPAAIENVFPVDNGAVLVVLADATSLTARLDTLPNADGALEFHPVTVPTGGAIVAGSGTRLVTFRYAGPTVSPQLFFSLVSGAGTPSSQTGVELDLGSPLGPIYSSVKFAPTPGGAVMLTANLVAVESGSAIGVKAARLATVLASTQATTFSGAQLVDYETYPDGNLGSQAVLGTAAIDESRAIVLAGVRFDGGAGTSVSLVERTTLGIITDSRATLAGDPSRWAVAGSNGFGYALGVEGFGSATFPSVYVFAPSCK
jgi:hypothetical protein